MTIPQHGPPDPDEDREQSFDPLPDTPGDPDDTRDPGQSESEPERYFQGGSGEGGSAGGHGDGGD